MWQSPRVRALPDEPHELGDVAVARAPDREAQWAFQVPGVHVQGHLHVLELVPLDELLLPAQELDLPFLPELETPLDVDELLGGDGEGDNPACQ